MQNILKGISTREHTYTPWILLLILSGYVFAGLFLFNFVGVAVVLPFFEFNLEDAISIFSNPYYSNEARIPLLIVQGVTSLGAFILIPLFFIRMNLNLPIMSFFTAPRALYQPILMTFLILFCFMTVNSVIIQWNQSIELPEFFSWFEEYAKSKEGELERLTKYLTSFDSAAQFLMGFIIIAIIPAVGEELLFRGLIQNLFNHAFKNAHLAIWLSAFLFGAFHLQFYGLVPRMLLGVLFGYLYYWSGHLSLAILGHFINNGFTLTLLYLSRMQVIDYDPVNQNNVPSVWAILIFLLIGSGILFLFRNYFLSKEDA